MAAAIETMAYLGATPWHGLGEKLDESDKYDWEKCRVKAGLDWDVELTDLVTGDTHQKVDMKGVRRKTDNKILGVVGPRFTPLQNVDAFKWFQPFLDAREAELNTAGALKEGSRVWVLAKLNRDPVEIVPNDIVEKYILLSHGHDGSLAVRVGFTPIRVVCQNTLSMAHGDKASKLIRIRHSKQVTYNLENIRDIMNVANQEFEATAEQYRLLARKSINQDDIRAYVKKVLKLEDKDSTRSNNIIEEVVGLTVSGRGNDNVRVRGTLWGAYNGITEYLSWQRGNSPDTRINALWYGEGATMSKSALDIALEMAA